MYFSFAALAPREREEPDAMTGMKDFNQEEEELGPPDEEYMGDLQEQQQEEEKPTAPDPAASSDGGPSAIPDTPAVHPMATPEHLILERRAPEEPTAPHTIPTTRSVDSAAADSEATEDENVCTALRVSAA